MITRPFDFDPETGIKRVFHYDDADDTFTIETEQDVTNLIEANKFIANSDDAQSRKNDVRRVASLPLSVYYDLKQRGIVDDPKRFRDWLNDSENQFFRTRPGKV